jgi:hypothetical protein
LPLEALTRNGNLLDGCFMAAAERILFWDETLTAEFNRKSWVGL